MKTPLRKSCSRQSAPEVDLRVAEPGPRGARVTFFRRKVESKIKEIPHLAASSVILKFRHFNPCHAPGILC